LGLQVYRFGCKSKQINMLIGLRAFFLEGTIKKLQRSKRWILPYKLKERYRNKGKNERIQLGEKARLK